MKHAGGRPTKYDSSICDRIDAYLETTGREQTTLPTREGFAHFIEVDTDTLVEWEKIHKEFSVAIKKLDETQKMQLINDGMYGGKEVNPAMAIFLLKNNHNMKDKQEVTGKDGQPLIPTPILGGVTKEEK